MCGIVGYTGTKPAVDVLMDGLKSLEYRGYDSAGISLLHSGALHTLKAKGRLQNLIDMLPEAGLPQSSCGIGHTRWATHGEPSDRNAHPHGTQALSLVHNGIIENYLPLKKHLMEQGYAFDSATDTEVLAKLLDSHYTGDPLDAIVKALRDVEGSYALGILFADQPDTLYAARKDSPLIVGLGEGENFIASDVPAILAYTRDYYLLEEGEIAILCAGSVEVTDWNGTPVHKPRLTATWNIAQAQKAGYPHFMLKEINEQPKVLADTIHPRIRDGLPCFAQDGLPEDFFARFDKIFFVACGTAMHAGMVGRSQIEQLARIPVEVDYASEFRYRNPILSPNSLVAVISQSGETADTLAALRLAKTQGITTLAIVNVAGSSIEREADYVLHTYAGPEIAVASTKAFAVQIGLLSLVALDAARVRGVLAETEIRRLTAALTDTIALTPDVIAYSDHLKQLASRFTETTSLFYMGRGIDHSLAMEGSLKLKEISYIHSEAYAAGELKHGTISLITDGTPIIGLATQKHLLAKTISNMKEVRSRGGYVLLIAQNGIDIDEDVYDDLITLPAAPEDIFLPLLSVIVLQLIAYHTAVQRGCDVDKPRNLAKSVTVE